MDPAAGTSAETLPPSSLRQLCDEIDKRHSALFSTGRPLRYDERNRLIEQGNWSSDWKMIRVAPGFIPDNIRNCRFSGLCYLGVFSGTTLGTHAGIPFASGLTDSHLRDSFLDDECCVDRCSIVNNYHVAGGAVLFSCGTISSSGKSRFGNKEQIIIGNETGERKVTVFAEMSLEDAIEAATDPLQRNVLHEKADDVLLSGGGLRYGIIHEHTIITNTVTIIDVLIGSFARIDGAARIENCTILSGSDEEAIIGTGALVKNSCMQWGCNVDSFAIVDHTLLVEHSHVKRHGKVTNSIIGPNTGIAEGEVTSSLVGPFVGFHHQALLIGTLWPEGKGNVGYGANVGSNHTGKAPDQELYCGEGLFFGLGVNIKFPADFSAAPFSMIATGVTTLPQRMSFPFSLVNTASRIPDGISPAFNELFPAWILSDNLYLVKRNEAKFMKRNAATRTTIPTTVFRPSIIDMMFAALSLLENAPKDGAFFTDRHIAGIGKNFVTAESVDRAIDTYRLHIEYYCLTGLYKYLRDSAGNRIALIETSLFETEAAGTVWEHCRTTYRSLGLQFSTPSGHLDRLVEIEAQLLQSVIDSKTKDALRGNRIMKDYDLSHAPVGDDPLIADLRTSFETLKSDVEELKTTCVIQ